jgi:AcrR family transcriptional regulator
MSSMNGRGGSDDAHAAGSLRERQAAVAREAILESVVQMLESGEPEEITLAEVAERAGVSKRTLYRYFPTRADLIAAAGDWIYERIGLPMDVDGAHDIVPSALEASTRSMRHLRLTRALNQSETGREIRSPRRLARAQAIERALAELTDGLDPAEAARVTAMIQYLSGSRTWLLLHDELGLDLPDAQAAMVWALETLLADVRRRSEGAPRAPGACPG